MENKDDHFDKDTSEIELIIEDLIDNQKGLRVIKKNIALNNCKKSLNGYKSFLVLNNLQCNLNHIVSLNISQCQLNSLPDELESLIFLKKIYLSFNKLETVPNVVLSCESLNYVDLSHNKLTEMPEPKCVKRLTYLNLSNNSFTYLPIWIQKVQCFNLFEFDFSFNQMNQCIHSEYWKLSYFCLNKLFLCNCNLLQDDFAFLKTIHTLKYLDISNSSANTSKNLKCKNLISDIDQLFINAEWAVRLIELNISNLGLNFIGDEIGCLQNLRVLQLQRNGLPYLPSGLYGLKNLTHLNLNDNRIDALSERIQQLVSLEELHLTNNMINVLPVCTNLKRLRVFDAFNNDLARFENAATYFHDHSQLMYDLDQNYVDATEIPGYVDARDKLRRFVNATARHEGPKMSMNDLEMSTVSSESSYPEEEDVEDVETVYEQLYDNQIIEEECWDDEDSSDFRAEEEGTNCTPTSGVAAYPASDDDWSLPENYNFFLLPKRLPRVTPTFPDVCFEDAS